MLKLFRIFMCGLALLPPLALADGMSEAECPEPGKEVALASELGSAGFVQNLAEHPASLRAVAGRLLEDALTDDAELTAAGCEPNCLQREVSEVVYRVTPTAFLATKDQRDVCLRFEDETSDHPLLFTAREFHTVAELNDWIMEFSQGRGEDGKLLYQRCSSNCSPRYTFLIAEQSSGYEVKAEVLCGLARDKSNDQYRISTALRWSCSVN